LEDFDKSLAELYIETGISFNFIFNVVI